MDHTCTNYTKTRTISIGERRLQTASAALRSYGILSQALRENKTSDCNDKVYTSDEFSLRRSRQSEHLRHLCRYRTKPYTATHNIDAWTAVTNSDVEDLISSSLNKTCQLDPAQTWLVKDFRGLLSPFIKLLFNKSLATFQQSIRIGENGGGTSGQEADGLDAGSSGQYHLCHGHVRISRHVTTILTCRHAVKTSRSCLLHPRRLRPYRRRSRVLHLQSRLRRRCLLLHRLHRRCQSRRLLRRSPVLPHWRPSRCPMRR